MVIYNKFILSISLLHLKESFTHNFKTARKKRFFNGVTSVDSYMSLCKQKNSISMNQ